MCKSTTSGEGTDKTVTATTTPELSLAKIWLRVGAVGVFAGAFSSIVGIGGGAVMVPLLSMWMAPHQVIGTVLAAIALSGTSGVATMFACGGTAAVNFPAAAAITACGIVTARFGAKLMSRIDKSVLNLILALAMLLAGPLVLFAKMLSGEQHHEQQQQQQQQQLSIEPIDAAIDGTDGLVVRVAPQAASFTSWDISYWAKLFGIGSVAGFMGGMLGVGGGIFVIPASVLFLGFTQQAAVGTSLAALILPTLVSLGTHLQLGNVHLRSVPPLLIGASVGAFIGARFALQLPEKDRTTIFVTVMTLLGLMTLFRKPRGKS